MLRSDDRDWLSVVAACAAMGVLGSDLLAQSPSTPQSPAVVKTVQVRPGELSGKIVHGGTRSAVGNHTMALRDTTGRVVARIATGPDGTYTTPPLPDGSYVLQVTDQLSLGLDVSQDAAIQTLDLVVPPSMMPAATPPPPATEPAVVPPAPGGAAAAAAAPSPVAAGIGVVGWGLIGTGAAAAVAVPVAIAASNSGGSSKENTVSSSSSRSR